MQARETEGAPGRGGGTREGALRALPPEALPRDWRIVGGVQAPSSSKPAPFLPQGHNSLLCHPNFLQVPGPDYFDLPLDLAPGGSTS